MKQSSSSHRGHPPIFCFTEVSWTHNVVLLSGVQHNEAHLCFCIYVYCEMITTMSLLNTHQHTWAQTFSLLMRTFKIYSLSNFQIRNTALWSKGKNSRYEASHREVTCSVATSL